MNWVIKIFLSIPPVVFYVVGSGCAAIVGACIVAEVPRVAIPYLCISICMTSIGVQRTKTASYTEGFRDHLSSSKWRP